MVTGEWSLKAYEEAKKYCKPHEVLNVIKGFKFYLIIIKSFFLGQKITSIADQKEWSIDTEGAYFYYCDNETITGLEFPFVPEGGPFLIFF